MWMSVIGGLAGIFLIIILILSIKPGSNPVKKIDDTLSSSVVSEASKPTKVENQYFDSFLGPCSYSGEVDEDGKPNGKGVAIWKTGDAEKYDGEWSHGKMEGLSTYTLKNGDIFEGTFKDDKYEKGKYTIKETGEYFEGSFKDSNPDKGFWYDSKGNKMS